MAPTPDRGEVVLVRHGETEWSRSGQHTGLTDIPLTEAGRAQARATGKRLRERAFARVLTSPLVRARETCALAGLEDRAEVVADLHEWDYGAYEGRTSADIRKERPGWVAWKDGFPEGELLSAVAARADRVIADIGDAAGDVVVFSHGHLLRVLGVRWCGLHPEMGGSFALDTAAVCVLGFEHDRRAIRRWNT